MPSQGAGQRRRAAAKPPRPPVRNARGGRNYEQQSPESVKNKLSVSVLLSVTAVCVMLAMLWGVWLLTRRPDALVAPPSVNQLFNVTATASVYDRGLVKAADLSYEAVLKVRLVSAIALSRLSRLSSFSVTRYHIAPLPSLEKFFGKVGVHASSTTFSLIFPHHERLVPYRY